MNWKYYLLIATGIIVMIATNIEIEHIPAVGSDTEVFMQHVRESQQRTRAATQKMQDEVRYGQPVRYNAIEYVDGVNLRAMEGHMGPGGYVLSHNEEMRYNAIHILPYNPVVGDDCVETSKDPRVSHMACSPVYRDTHPLAHHNLATLREMAEYDPEAAMWIVEHNLDNRIKEQLRLAQLAAKLSGKTADLEKFEIYYAEMMEKFATYIETDEGMTYVAENMVREVSDET